MSAIARVMIVVAADVDEDLRERRFAIVRLVPGMTSNGPSTGAGIDGRGASRYAYSGLDDMSASGGGPRCRGLRLAAALVLPLVLSLAASAQEGFRIAFTVDRTGAEHAVITGTVSNDARQEVLDVSVTAEALDAKGKVVARGIAYVSGRIPGQASAPFTAKVPVVASVTRFRVSVSSFRAGLGAQAP